MVNRPKAMGNQSTEKNVLQGVVTKSYVVNVPDYRGRNEDQMRIIVQIGNRTYLKNIICARNACKDYIKVCGTLDLFSSDWEVHSEWLIGKTVSVTLKTYKGNLYIDEIWYPEDVAEEESDFREIKDFGEVEGFYPDIA